MYRNATPVGAEPAVKKKKRQKKCPKEGRELTNEEVAEELGVTRQCVQQTEQRALKKLLKKLEEMGLTKDDLI